ncbi:uncharacterized protein LOC122310192 [Carya illinoinensis]|uniref:uncharacterized protein LOC122310192 n=1 Tax=Carya illinoinensis TaxID=32201 RepID=UPI001C72576B|nr:uncharacterized protein LOC122310192 [Carya illinoinensis]
MAENEHHDREMGNQNRTLRDYLQPVRTGTPSCIIQPLNANNFNFKPGIIPLIPHFHGMDSENPYLHIKEFEEVCSIFMDRTCTEEVIRLKLFPFSLKDKAKTWLNSLKPRTIGWKSHPNLSWTGDQHVAPTTLASGPSQLAIQAPPMQKKGLEDTIQQLSMTLQQFMQGQATLNNQNSLPHQVQAISEDPNLKSVKAVTTLRSGKVVNIPAHEPYNSGKAFNPSNKDGEHVSDEHEKIHCPIPAPFPQRLVPLHKDKHLAEILEVFRQVRINIPLLDALQQIPAYAKFLKDLCTVKRKLNVHKKAFLTEQVSAIIQSNTPPKYKDPGAPTIACVIGNSKIGHALLDLGSSVNLLPYTVYEQLGLGELKSTPIILQLADRSIKMPRGIVEDVLVQVDKFYYPVDFVVLDMNLSNPSTFQAPVILGRPFLATSNALINCRSGILKLSFGNMTLELNIFNTCRQPQDLEEVQEVNLLENIIDEDFHLNHSSTDLQLSLESILSDVNILDDTSNISFAGIGHEVLWQPMFEKSPPWAASIKPSSDNRNHFIGALRTLENSNLRDSLDNTQ